MSSYSILQGIKHHDTQFENASPGRQQFSASTLDVVIKELKKEGRLSSATKSSASTGSFYDEVDRVASAFDHCWWNLQGSTGLGDLLDTLIWCPEGRLMIETRLG